MDLEFGLLLGFARIMQLTGTLTNLSAQQWHVVNDAYWRGMQNTQNSRSQWRNSSRNKRAKTQYHFQNDDITPKLHCENTNRITLPSYTVQWRISVVITNLRFL